MVNKLHPWSIIPKNMMKRAIKTKSLIGPYKQKLLGHTWLYIYTYNEEPARV